MITFVSLVSNISIMSCIISSLFNVLRSCNVTDISATTDIIKISKSPMIVRYCTLIDSAFLSSFFHTNLLYQISGVPVISGGCSIPNIFKSVGATSANIPIGGINDKSPFGTSPAIPACPSY